MRTSCSDLRVWPEGEGLQPFIEMNCNKLLNPIVAVRLNPDHFDKDFDAMIAFLLKYS